MKIQTVTIGGRIYFYCKDFALVIRKAKNLDTKKKETTSGAKIAPMAHEWV